MSELKTEGENTHSYLTVVQMGHCFYFPTKERKKSELTKWKLGYYCSIELLAKTRKDEAIIPENKEKRC